MQGMDALYLYQKKYGKLPPALATRPYPDKAVRFYIDVFYRLSAHRTQSESGPNPLYISEMLAYLRLLGYSDQDDLLFAVDVLQACDRVYLDEAHKKLKADREAAQARSKLRSK